MTFKPQYSDLQGLYYSKVWISKIYDSAGTYIYQKQGASTGSNTGFCTSCDSDDLYSYSYCCD